MTKLYELTGNYKELLSLTEDAEIPEEAIRDTLEAIEGEFNEKAVRIGEVVNSVGSDIAAIDAEIERLQARKRVIQNKDKSIREYLKTNMEACGISKIECPLFTITLAKGRDVAVIDDEDDLPDDYIAVKTSTQPDKKAILAALKAGEEVPGAHLSKSEPSLIIK